MKYLTKTAGVLLVAGMSLLPASCGYTSDHYHIEGEYQGHRVVVRRDGRGRMMNIYNKQGGWLYVLDRRGHGPDGRFDEINLDNLEKGSPIEQFANLQRLEEIFDEVKNSD